MRKSWLIAAVVGGAAGAAQAADVQLFGIHIPQTHEYAVYARISNPASVNPPSAGQSTVAGISSLSAEVLNAGAATVATAENRLPMGDINDPGAIDQKYGFWLFRPPAPTVNATGAHNIEAAQYAEYAPADAARYDQYVLQGVGLRSGTKPAGGTIVTPSTWAFPVLVGKGTYTGDAGTAGLGLRFTPGSGTNLLRDANPDPAVVNYSGADPAFIRLEGAATSTVVDSKTITTGALVAGTSTTKAGRGDANLDGQVSFPDLVALAQNYNQSGKTWFQGDFNLDQEVNFTDLVALAQNYGQPVPASGTFSAAFEGDMAAAFAQVPEPASVAGITLGAMALCARRRRK